LFKNLDKLHHFVIIYSVHYNSLQILQVSLRKENLVKPELKAVESFDEIQKSFGEVRLEIPKLDPDMMQDPSRLADMVKATTKGVKQVREGISHALSWLDQTQKWIDQLQDEDERQIAGEATEDDLRRMEEYVQECLTHKEKAFRRTAGTVYLCHVFDKDIQDCNEANKLLTDLKDRGFLKEDPEGPMSIGYRRHQVSESFGFSNMEIERIETAVDRFSRKLKQLINQQRAEQKEELELQGENSLSELMEGKKGQCLLRDIPPENFVDRDEKDCWRPGGSILVRLVNIGNRKIIQPLEAVGAIQPSIEQAANLGVSLELHTLDWDGPPGMGKSFQRIVDGVMRTKGFSETEAEEYVRKTQFFWHLIRRAIEASKNKEKMEALKDDYEKETDIAPEEFYGLDCEAKEGTVLLVFDGSFKNKDSTPPVFNLFGLFEQTRENGEFFVEFLKGPEHVEEFLAEFKGKKFSTERNFRAAQGRLGRMLRGIRGQTDMAVQTS